MHDAWLAKEFFYKKKKNYVYGPKECLDCGKLVGYYSMSKHRRFYCKSRQPVALDSVRQGRPAEKDAVLEPPPPPEAPLDADGGALGDDRQAALMPVGRPGGVNPQVAVSAAFMSSCVGSAASLRSGLELECVL